tara:strand:+ start:102 stop:650 length:549 start_codon:yes stop_codon:yes gene_type:complete
MSYFSKFPLVTRNGVTTLDITRRPKISKSVSAYQYLPYTVEEGMKPEDVAFYYYGDAELAWLVLLANDVIDPYTHWPKSQPNLESYIKKQYATQSGTTGDAVLIWSKNTSITNNIKHYESRYVPDVKINHTTYVANPTAEFRPIRIYDYEFALNESRRQILLFNKNYMGDIESLLEKSLNGQ